MRIVLVLLLAAGVAGGTGPLIRIALNRYLDPGVEWGMGTQLTVQAAATAAVMALLLWVIHRTAS